jgi:hypothetical protein
MTSAALQDGLQRLCQALYSPAAFGERMLRFIDRFGAARGKDRGASPDASPLREVDAQAIEVALGVRRLGPAESEMWHRVWSAASRRPGTAAFVTRMLLQYAQIRYMFQRGRFWTPEPGTSLGEARPASIPTV